MTEALGININRMHAVVFALGVGLATIAGMVAAPISSVYPNMGSQVLIMCFVVVVIGGIGSLPGAVIGGLMLGFLENFVPALFAGTTEYKDTFAFFLLIIILLIRPSGIIGEDLSEKV